MGRSRITRTFHNKPTSKKKDISNKSQSVSKMTKQKASSTQASPTQVKSKTEIAYKQKYVKRNTGNTRLLYKKRDENIRRPLPGEVKNSPSIILPQAHAQEATHMDQKRGFNPPFTTGKDGRPTGGTDAGVIETIKRSKTGYNVSGPGGSNDKTMYMNMDSDDLSTYGGISGQKSLPPKTKSAPKERTILGKFAQGVGNEAQDIGGVPHGLITGQDYKTKSILSKATEHAFRGDWDSAGKVISDNPYRFAGNVATNVGLSVIPFGIVARGAGLAGKAGGIISKGLSKGGKGGSKVRATAAKALNAQRKSKSNITQDSQGNWVKKGSDAKKSYAGGKYTNQEINNAERLIQKAEWMPWGKPGKVPFRKGKLKKNISKMESTKNNARKQSAIDEDRVFQQIRKSENYTPDNTPDFNPRMGQTQGSFIRESLGKTKSKVSKLKRSYKYANPDKRTFEGKVGRAKMLPQKIRDKKGDIALKIKKKTYYSGFSKLHGKRRESINNPDYWGGQFGPRTGGPKISDQAQRIRGADLDIWEVGRFNKGTIRQQKPKSSVGFAPTAVPKNVGIGYDEYY